MNNFYLFCWFRFYTQIIFHRASGSPGYGTLPLHWHQKQNRPKRWGKVPKNAKKKRKILLKRLILVLLSTHVERVSVACMLDFSMASLRFLPNLCHVDNLKSIWGIYFPVESHKTFCGHSGLYKPTFQLLSRNPWEAELHLFITTNLQTIARGAQGHPTGSIISRFVPFPMNYLFIVSKHSIS